jgi:hypothetical protein
LLAIYGAWPAQEAMALVLAGVSPAGYRQRTADREAPHPMSLARMNLPFRHSLGGRLLTSLALPILVIFSALIVSRSINTFAVARQQTQLTLRHMTDQIAT